ncbi:YggS family pyridoxal phosphate-dependent enzyme [Fluviispira multicolorata]|uniref:Pyridoxal phosphate homeostasis protein n=1 Tax=Fluviispira multicolorata TaxID=2654512 RepID=A0A833N7W2_9BACT|nr:YggS family pyridoxal phosphate-dependent enzyme [Fluviispira multicolorata]KAB8033386.1 YggS family pyridoxal phosphate-dependent enzyme [Fluviispira multicolorata]
MENKIKKNISEIQDQINFFAKKYQRDSKEINLIAVSKYHTTESIKAAYECGIENFGENYIQEWQKKHTALNNLPNIKWHLIGHIQSNKAKYINSNIHCIHSIDKLNLAKEIEKKSNIDSNLKIKALVQLQIDKNDKNKSGISFENAKELCSYIVQSKKMKFAGFMGIGPEETNKDYLRKSYEVFAKNSESLWQSCADNSKEKYILSLGMSSDYEIAIEHGSTLLRIGTAIFGKKK